MVEFIDITDGPVDPDETQPGLLIETGPYVPPVPPPAWSVDHAAFRLAQLCAGWAHRGRSLQDLVGLVPDCRCVTRVLPRAELAARLDPGPRLDALRAIGARPGRLAVVEVALDWGRREPEYRDHHIHVPQVEVPDTRGLLEPLPADRRAQLGRNMAEKPYLTIACIKHLLDHRGVDAIYMRAELVEQGAIPQLYPRRYASAEQTELLDAAEYDAHPGKIVCLVHPDKVWQQQAVAWVALEDVGLPLEHACCPKGHSRLHEILREMLGPGASCRRRRASRDQANALKEVLQWARSCSPSAARS